MHAKNVTGDAEKGINRSEGWGISEDFLCVTRAKEISASSKSAGFVLGNLRSMPPLTGRVHTILHILSGNQNFARNSARP
jgi:hypothetical protein